jgi:endonuclease YncB( thermonuclease family)
MQIRDRHKSQQRSQENEENGVKKALSSLIALSGLHEAVGTEVQLNGIDSPERGQAFGNCAR